MTTIDLLRAFRDRGIQLSFVAGKLRYHGPPGALDADLRRSAIEHRADLLAQLGAPPSAWDAVQADAELRQAIAAIDRAMSAIWLGHAHRNLLSVFRQQVSDYHARHDPQLFGFHVWVAAHNGRWEAECRARHRNRVEAASTPTAAENPGDRE